VIAYLLLGLLWCGTAFGQGDVDAGMKALEANRFAEAEEIFQKAVKAEPADFSAWFHLAMAQSLQSVADKDRAATANYRKVLELKPGLYEAELNLGVLLLRQKLHKEAVGPLEAAVAAKPELFRPQFYYAEALMESGRPVQAEAAYRKAIALDPKSAHAHLGLGQALLGQGKTEAGAEYFFQAAALDSAYQPTLLQLAMVYEADKNRAAAIAIYKRFPSDAGARERLAELLLAEGKAGEAIPELEAAVKASKTVANLTALANAYLQNKEPAKCEPLLNEALRMEPQNAELRLLYGRLLRDLKKYDLAAQQFYLCAKLNPQTPEPWSDLAMMSMLIERYDVGLAALDRLKALEAEKPGHKYLRAITLDKLKQNKPALAAYQDFLASAGGKFPEEEFKARQRARILQQEINKR
jgi:tetratricopeptide (TPR) repeat protein